MASEATQRVLPEYSFTSEDFKKLHLAAAGLHVKITPLIGESAVENGEHS